MSEREQLRERIGVYFTWAMPVDEECGEYPAWDQLTDEDQAYGLKMADAILDEIEAAGYVLYEADLADDREDASEMDDDQPHDCDREYRHDCARCNGVSPFDAGAW